MHNCLTILLFGMIITYMIITYNLTTNLAFQTQAADHLVSHLTTQLQIFYQELGRASQMIDYRVWFTAIEGENWLFVLSIVRYILIL